MKFLDPDKPSWQNGSALEVIHKIMVRPNLLKFICMNFDMNEHSTRVFRDMINGKIYKDFDPFLEVKNVIKVALDI